MCHLIGKWKIYPLLFYFDFDFDLSKKKKKPNLHIFFYHSNRSHLVYKTQFTLLLFSIIYRLFKWTFAAGLRS